MRWSRARGAALAVGVALIIAACGNDSDADEAADAGEAAATEAGTFEERATEVFGGDPEEMSEDAIAERLQDAAVVEGLIAAVWDFEMSDSDQQDACEAVDNLGAEAVSAFVVSLFAAEDVPIAEVRPGFFEERC